MAMHWEAFYPSLQDPTAYQPWGSTCIDRLLSCL